MGKLRVIEGSPQRDVLEAIAETKRRLRRGDVRALAVVLVSPGGEVSTVIAGTKGGNYHQLASGIARLGWRFQSET
jgi:hypothetical protein